MKESSSSAIFKTMYHNGSCLLLVLKFHLNNSFYFETNAPSFKRYSQISTASQIFEIK